MQKSLRFLVLVSASAFLFALAAHAQDSDSQSLGDAARNARLQKQQKDAQANKSAPVPDASAKDASPSKTPKKVITNDEIPEHIGPTRTAGSQNQAATDAQQGSGDAKAPADYWKSQIQAQKTTIASMESQIKSLEDSIQYAGANCVSGCVQWNERQQQKQSQVEALKSQLEEQRKHLEDMQESARTQGYGSSVYDP